MDKTYNLQENKQKVLQQSKSNSYLQLIMITVFSMSNPIEFDALQTRAPAFSLLTPIIVSLLSNIIPVNVFDNTFSTVVNPYEGSNCPSKYHFILPGGLLSSLHCHVKLFETFSTIV